MVLLYEIMEEFLKYNKTMPLQAAASFLYAAIHEDKEEGAVTLAKRRGISPTVMSRYMLDMGERGRDMQPGLGLVSTQPDLANLRAHPVKITPKGNALLDRLDARLERAGRVKEV
jgi:DNA-binding MarR family transcriptional regulator